MPRPLTFTASALAPSAPACVRSLCNLTPDDSEAGGFAKLLRATLDDGTLVAVKRFHRHIADGDAFAADGLSAQREFDCLCRLDGADGHAPRALALGTCTDKQGLAHHAIVMEYIEGLTVEAALASGVLAQGLHRHDKTHTLMRAALHIADALEACDARVVHRDVSPANVMLVMSGRGEVSRAVLIDWGQSVNTSSPFVTPALGEGRKLATVCFGAPCVFGGPFYDERNEPAVDVYGFGALLYYMRTRRLPFAELADGSLMTPEHVELIAEAKRQPLSLADAMPSMRPLEHALDDVIKLCTSFDPHARPTIAQVRCALASALGEEAKTSTPTDAERETTAGSADAETAASTSVAKAAAKNTAWENVAESSLEDDFDFDSIFESIAESLVAKTPSEMPSETPAPTSNEPDKLFRRAMSCFYGHDGMECDPQQSTHLLERAAQSGSVEAMFTLGRNLTLGIGVPADRKRGTQWLKRASEQGHPGALALL